MQRSSFHLRNQRGLSLVETMIATAISVGVLLAAYQAYTHFNQKTQVELSKLDEVKQFSLLTKDFLKFAESAGLSTVYLNMPVSFSSCVDDNKPCLRRLDGENFVPFESAPVIKGLTGKSCGQFFRDSHGDLKTSNAYNLTGGMSEQVNRFQNYNVQDASSDYYLTWPMMDSNSIPFIMLKARDITQYFRMMPDPDLFQYEHAAFEAKQSFRKAFFESNVSPDKVKDYVGYPFLIYGGKYQNQFGIYVAKEIVFCDKSPGVCKSGLGGLVDNTSAIDVNRFKLPLGAPDADSIAPHVYMITLDKIDFNQSAFFAPVISGIKSALGADAESCFKTWAATSGADAQYLFPSGRLSLFNAPSTASSATTSDGFYNPMQYNKHASIEANAQEMGAAPYLYMIPIDIVRYSVKGKSLMSELWHLTDKKEAMKLTNVSPKTPFYFTRKLGSPEISLWYNFKR